MFSFYEEKCNQRERKVEDESSNGVMEGLSGIAASKLAAGESRFKAKPQRPQSISAKGAKNNGSLAVQLDDFHRQIPMGVEDLEPLLLFFGVGLLVGE